jgi:hypothetical protein
MMNDETADGINAEANRAVEEARGWMRGKIHTQGITAAMDLASVLNSEDLAETLRWRGILEAAYDAGRLAGIEQSRKLQASGVSVEVAR